MAAVGSACVARAIVARLGTRASSVLVATGAAPRSAGACAALAGPTSMNRAASRLEPATRRRRVDPRYSGSPSGAGLRGTRSLGPPQATFHINITAPAPGSAHAHLGSSAASLEQRHRLPQRLHDAPQQRDADGQPCERELDRVTRPVSL